MTVGEGSVVGGIVNQGVGSAAGEGTAVGASVDTTVGDAASMVVVPGSGVGTTGCSGVGTTVGGAGVTVGNGIEVGDGLGRDAGGRVGGVRVAVGITAFSVGPTAIAGAVSSESHATSAAVAATTKSRTGKARSLGRSIMV